LQAPKAVIERGADLSAIEFGLTVANVGNAVAGSRDLRGYDPVGSVAPALEVISYVLLSGCVGFRARRHRVHLGRIYEVDAGSLRPVDLGECLGLVVLFYPCHGAEAK